MPAAITVDFYLIPIVNIFHFTYKLSHCQFSETAFFVEGLLQNRWVIIYGAAAPSLCLKIEKAGSEEPAIHGIIRYDE